MAKQNLKVTAKKGLAVLTTAALLLSCGMTGLFTANAAGIDETVASAAVGEPTDIRIFDANGKDITDNPFVYLDNSLRAGGPTSTTVSAKVTDEKGNVVSTDIHAALDPQPSGTPYVTGRFTNQSTVELYAASYDSKGVETSYKSGTTRLHFTAANGTLYRDITVVVYKPAKDVKLFWGEKNNQLQLNDYCPNNNIEVMAIANHKVQIYSEFVDKDSTDKMEYHVYDGYFSGYPTGKETSTKAEITEDGLFTPKENGEVTIYAKAKATETSDRTISSNDKRVYVIDDNGDKKTETWKDVVSMPKYIHVIIVKENPAKSLSITNNPEALEANETYQLELEKEPTYAQSQGYETGATDVIRWESSNKSVATVDSKGLVTAVGKGDVKITAYGENENVYAECNIRVLTKATSVVISPKPVTTRVGVSVELNAKMDPDTADDEIVWTSSDPSIATVESKNPGQFTNTQTAIVTGVTEGTVTITATAKNSGCEDKCTVTVNKKILSDNLTLSTTQGTRILPVAEDSTLTVYTNNDLTVDARLTSEEGIDADDTVEWSVSDNQDNVTILNQDSKSITVHGSIEGTVKVTATSKANSSITKSFNVNILKSCDIGKSNLQNANNTNQSFVGTVYLQRGNLLAIKADLRIDNNNYPYRHSDDVASWTSSNPQVATVDNNGNVRAISDTGTAVITMTTLSGNRKQVTISTFTTSDIILGNVTKPASDDELPTATINLNQSTFTQSARQITTTVKDQYASSKNGAACTWSSSDEEVAVVSETGYVTPKGVGTTIITAKSGVVESSCIVSVTVPIDNIRAEFGEIENYTYSPLIKSYEPKVTVEVDGKTLFEDIDYTIEYKNNTKASTGSSSAVLVINGKGLYTGKKEIPFKINPKPLDETDFTVAPIEDQKCTGSEIRPKVQIECLGTPLEEGVDYTLSYINASKPSTNSPATIKITGKSNSNYTGELTTTFNIYCNHEERNTPIIVKKPEYENNGIQKETCKICGEIIETEITYTGKYGDVTNDSNIKSDDALSILRYSVKLDKFNDYQIKLADVNKDGSVDSLDSLTVLRYSVGLIDEGAVTGTEESDFSK